MFGVNLSEIGRDAEYVFECVYECVAVFMDIVVVLIVPDLFKQKQTYLTLQQYTCAR